MKLVVNRTRSAFDVYIGRPSKWGNPFSHKPDTQAKFRVATRQEAIAKYREWILTQPQLIASLHELFDKVLGCWCKPDDCHGDVLLELVELLCVDCRRAFREAKLGGGYRCLRCYQNATIPDNDDG